MVISKEKMENLFDMTYHKVIENKRFTTDALEVIAKMEQVEDFKLERDEMLALSYFIVGYSYVPYIMAIEPTKEQRDKQIEHIEGILQKFGNEYVATLGEIEDAFNSLRKNPKTREIISNAYSCLEKIYSEEVIYETKTFNIFNLLVNSQFALNHLKNVHDFLKLGGKYTPENLIKLSTFIAEKSVMTPDSRQSLAMFNKDEDYIQKLQESRDLFALIRNFMVLEEFVYNLIDRECDMLGYVESEVAEEVVDEEVTEPQVDVAPENKEDVEIIGYDTEVANLFKVGTIDEVLDAIIEGESGIDVDGFIRFLIDKTGRTINNWKDTENLSAEIVKEQIVKYGERYNELVKILTQEIPEEEKKLLVTKIENVLKVVFVQDITQKINLLNQLEDNMVNSYQQFLELMSSFEQCLAMGSNADVYVNLIEFVNSKYDLEQHSQNLTEAQNIEIKISMLTRLKDFIERK